MVYITKVSTGNNIDFIVVGRMIVIVINVVIIIVVGNDVIMD